MSEYNSMILFYYAKEVLEKRHREAGFSHKLPVNMELGGILGRHPAEISQWKQGTKQINKVLDFLRLSEIGPLGIEQLVSLCQARPIDGHSDQHFRALRKKYKIALEGVRSV